MFKMFLCVALVLAKPAFADQSYDAQRLVALFNITALSRGAQLHPTDVTFIEHAAIAGCTLQFQRTVYRPADRTATFVILTHDIGDMSFDTETSGKRYVFADYADEPNRARLNYRVDPPNARYNQQVHPLMMSAPIRAAVPTAWSATETFGVGSFIMTGNISESDVTDLLAAFDAYQATYCG